MQGPTLNIKLLCFKFIYISSVVTLTNTRALLYSTCRKSAFLVIERILNEQLRNHKIKCIFFQGTSIEQCTINQLYPLFLYFYDYQKIWSQLNPTTNVPYLQATSLYVLLTIADNKIRKNNKKPSPPLLLNSIQMKQTFREQNFLDLVFSCTSKVN